METTFHNVEITIKAPTPADAYTKLCEVLEVGVKENLLEYATDTFTTDTEPDDKRGTEEIWPVHT